MAKNGKLYKDGVLIYPTTVSSEVYDPESGETVKEQVDAIGPDLEQLKPKDIEEEGLYICNENGEALLRLDVLDTKNGIGENLRQVILNLIENNQSIKEVTEDGFYICNEYGEVIAKFLNNKWTFLNLDGTAIINPIFSAACGKESGVVKADSLSNATLTLTSFPQYKKRNYTISFGARITSFNQIEFGVTGGYLVKATIDSTNVTLYYSATVSSTATLAHGLTISDWISGTMEISDKNVKVRLSTLGGYSDELEWTLYANEIYGRPTLIADSSTTLTDVILRGDSKDFQKPVWFVGDSYVSVVEKRWPMQLLNMGVENWLLLGLAGGTSATLYTDLLLALQFGTPAYLVWCMGMNDKDTSTAANESWTTYLGLLEAKCAELGITLILTTIPNIPSRSNELKNTIVRNSGYRWIGLAEAVHGETYTSGVDNWYDGYLEEATTPVHTTVLGAKAQAARIINELPEILRNN